MGPYGASKKVCRGSPDFQNFPEFSRFRHLEGGGRGVIRSHTRKVGKTHIRLDRYKTEINRIK